MNENRRKFLKLLLVGGGALLIGKVLSSVSEIVNEQPASKKNPIGKKNPKDFRVVDNDKKFSVYDNSGEEVLQIDKET